VLHIDMQYVLMQLLYTQIILPSNPGNKMIYYTTKTSRTVSTH